MARTKQTARLPARRKELAEQIDEIKEHAQRVVVILDKHAKLISEFKDGLKKYDEKYGKLKPAEENEDVCADGEVDGSTSTDLVKKPISKPDAAVSAKKKS